MNKYWHQDCTNNKSSSPHFPSVRNPKVYWDPLWIRFDCKLKWFSIWAIMRSFIYLVSTRHVFKPHFCPAHGGSCAGRFGFLISYFYSVKYWNFFASRFYFTHGGSCVGQLLRLHKSIRQHLHDMRVCGVLHILHGQSLRLEGAVRSLISISATPGPMPRMLPEKAFAKRSCPAP